MKLIVGVGWASRLTAVSLSLLNTRLLVDLTGLQGLATQAIVASIAPWIMLLNFGLPASTQNLISEWRAENRNLDLLRSTAARLAFWTFAGFAPLTVLIAMAVKHFLLSDYPFVSIWAIAAACACFLLTAITAVLTSMLYAEHRSLWPNLSPGITSIVLFGSLLALKQFGIRDINLVVAIYFAPAGILAMGSLRALNLNLSAGFDRECASMLWRNAKGFLAVAILGTSTLSVDYIILSHVLSHEELAAYNLTGRLFLVIPVIHAVLLAAAWTPIGDLYVKKQLVLARRYTWRVVQVGLGLALVSGAATVLLAPWLLALLSGHAITGTGLVFRHRLPLQDL